MGNDTNLNNIYLQYVIGVPQAQIPARTQTILSQRILMNSWPHNAWVHTVVQPNIGGTISSNFEKLADHHCCCILWYPLKKRGKLLTVESKKKTQQLHHLCLNPAPTTYWSRVLRQMSLSICSLFSSSVNGIRKVFTIFRDLNDLMHNTAQHTVKYDSVLLLLVLLLLLYLLSPLYHSCTENSIQSLKINLNITPLNPLLTLSTQTATTFPNVTLDF